MEMVLACVMMGLMGPLVNFVLSLTNLEPTVLKVNKLFPHCVVITCVIFGTDCTCINGICDNGPMGSGQCRPGSCEVGFTGDNCDVGIPHCGILNDTCHKRATCLLINRTEEYTYAVYGNL